MKRRRGSFRTIPPWWANPIVFIPVGGCLAIFLACIAVAYVKLWSAW